MHLTQVLPKFYIQRGLHKKEHSSLCLNDDIYDMIINKKMLKGYGDGSFGGGTGPSIQCLDKRKRTRNDSILTKLCNQAPAM